MMEAFYTKKPILVTGGAGFIGSHLTEKLVDLGAQVTVLDDLSTGSLNNLERVKKSITFIHGSIHDPNTCLSATKNQQIIFHVAARISVAQSMQNPDDCYKTNVIGTLNILQAAQKNMVHNVVFSSSSAVYGFQETSCSEQMPCMPTSPYGHSKRIGELLCQHYATTHALSTVILRYFNVYGERQSSHGSYAAVIPRFRENMALNNPITIYGDGLQKRDFVHVSDIVFANMVTGLLSTQGEIFNIATGNSITLLQLVDQLKEGFPHFTAGIIFQPARSGDIMYSSADCSKWHKVLTQYPMLLQETQEIA